MPNNRNFIEKRKEVSSRGHIEEPIPINSISPKNKYNESKKKKKKRYPGAYHGISEL